MVFAAPCALLPNAFFDAVTIIFAFTVTIFLFFRCGGLCAAHPPPPGGRAERAKSKILVAFLNSKSLALEAYLKVRLEIQA